MKQVIKEHTFFDDLFRREIVLVDLGAARGEFSLEMSKRYPFAKAILVEPNPNNLKCIPEIPNSVVYPNLIGNNSGEVNTFFEDVKWPYNGSKVFPNNNCVEHQVETITLSDIIERHQISYIDLLKVDVEGTEYEILLSGNDHVFQMCRQITVEFHDFLDVSLKPKTLLIIERFRQMGFEMIANPGHWGFGSDHYDVLFYKKEVERANFLWVGPQFTRYEEVSLKSFIHNGFDVRVWSYDTLELPPGASPMDARLILPQDHVGKYTQGGKPKNLAAFSDVFRYTLLATRCGEWWFDTDCICLKDAAGFRELKAGKKLVVGREDQVFANCACLSFVDAELAQSLLQAQSRIIESKSEFVWGEIGPRLLTDWLNGRNLTNEILPNYVFYPIYAAHVALMNEPSYCEQLKQATEVSYVCHLWNEILATQIDKHVAPREGSYLEFLFQKYS